MKILYAPYNIASMPAITVDALNKIPGIEARGVSIVNPKSQNFGTDPKKYWKIFNVYGSIKNPFSFIWNCILAEFYLCKRILWADAIIWQWDARIFLPHFWFLKFCGKPLLIEWIGDDIRVPKIALKNNPYFQKVMRDKIYSYPKMSGSRSLRIQKKFKFLKAKPYLCPEMTLFLDRNLFPEYFGTYQRIEVKKYNPKYPDIFNNMIKIIHTPSATGAKGTPYLRVIIEKLKETHQFEYIEISNKSHEEALNAIKQADIFLDQFIGGSYGMATCEALSMGKPVFCYLMQPFIKLLPEDCPIINANLDNLESKLVEFLTDGVLRNQTGIHSRKYAETYHDVDKLIIELLEIVNSIFQGSPSRHVNKFN